MFDNDEKEAKEILSQLGIKYIVSTTSKSCYIKFYKDNKCIRISEIDKSCLGFRLLYEAKKLKNKKTFRIVEENDFITNICLYLLDRSKNNNLD
ncbi:unknown [Parabacteroides sp. CAG:409]|nr:unknown [Parabacteroides sp. CAG:409]